MTDATPPDWVLIEAAKRCEWLPGKTIAQMRGYLDGSGAFRALCDMILKHEQPPVDRKLLCAREACAAIAKSHAGMRFPYEYLEGTQDDSGSMLLALRAIKLWEERFGK